MTSGRTKAILRSPFKKFLNMTDFLVEMHLVDELVGRLIIDDKFVLGNKILRLAVQHTADNVGLPNEGSKAKCLVSSKKGKKNKNEMNNLLTTNWSTRKLKCGNIASKLIHFCSGGS